MGLISRQQISLVFSRRRPGVTESLTKTPRRSGEPIQLSVAAIRSHTKPSTTHSSGMVNSMILVTGTGDHDRPEWLITINGIRNVRTFDSGARIALEIEWNNKDPFYDRDLENFKRLHADGAISVGIIVTRGRSLHENMRSLVRQFLDERQIQQLDDLRQWGYDPTSRQRSAITKRITRAKIR